MLMTRPLLRRTQVPNSRLEPRDILLDEFFPLCQLIASKCHLGTRDRGISLVTVIKTSLIPSYPFPLILNVYLLYIYM